MTQSGSVPNPIVGTWKVVSFQFEFEGTDERRDVYDEHPAGFIIITAEGRMMTVVTAGVRAPDAAPSALFDSMTAYSGRYRLQGDDCFVTTVDSARHPAWVGTEQTCFFKRDGDTLSITSPLQQHPKFPERRIRGVIVWRKE
jgi:Lipocalin-like domain